MAIITNDTKEGEVFTGKPKTFSWERLWAFSGSRFRLEGWPSKNVHTDLDFAKGAGLPSIGASAAQYQCHLVELMIDLFGVEWLSHGWMDMKFIALVDHGDVLVSKAVVQSKAVEDDATKFTMDVYSENQRGEKVQVGLTTGFIGKVTSRGVEDYNRRLAELEADPTINHDVPVRRKTEPFEFIVNPELNQQYCYGEEDFHPRYIEETEIGPPIAHPGLLLNYSNQPRDAAARPAQAGVAGLNTHDEAFWINPVRVGKKVIVNFKGTMGTYERRGLTYTINEMLLVDEDGLDILRRLHRDAVASTATEPYRKSR